MRSREGFHCDPDEFGGKRVLVTGGAQDVGEAVVRHFARGGATFATLECSTPHEGSMVTLFVQADVATREGIHTVVRKLSRNLVGSTQ